MRRIIVIFIMFVSCINPYHLNLDDADSHLVVEGYVSSRAGDSEIKLSRSGAFQRTVFDWIADAELMVIENEMVEHQFAYQDNGLYTPVQKDFAAKKESSYRLRIILDGQEYESDPVSLQGSLAIESMSFRAVTTYQGGVMQEEPGLELLLTSNIDEDASRYYIYSFEETWKVVAGYSLNKIITPIFIYDENQELINIDFETVFEENVKDCWPSNIAEGITTSTTEGLSQNQLINVPVFRVNLESTRLLYRYSVLVNQYAISREAHHFFKMLKEFSENSGFLYNIQPGYVEGNIHNRNTPEEKVIGLFYAASHSSARIFISHSELPAEVRSVVRNHYPTCEYIEQRYEYIPDDELPVVANPEELLYLRDTLLRAKNMAIRDFWYGSYLWVQLADKPCVDCRVYGSNIEPEWWK